VTVTEIYPGLVCPPRFGTLRDFSRATLGGAVGEVARLLGKPFMPWQQYVADVINEIDPDTGELAYSEWGLTVPRQSGKSTLVLAKNVHRGSATKFFGTDQNMIYTAQTRKDAKLKFEEDFVKIVRASAYFKTRVHYKSGTGVEHFRYNNGSRWAIEANTEKAGHGGTLNEADIDEAFAQVDWRLEQAFEPAMVTVTNARLGWLSTAGWIDGSPYLQAKTKSGREAVALGKQSELAYFEWSAPEDADPGDPEVWKACMPALGITQPLKAIQKRYDKAILEGKLNGFKRAYLNMWVPQESDEPPTISALMWASRRDDDISFVGRPALSVDVSLDRTLSFITAAGLLSDGNVGVRLLSVLEGTELVVKEIGELRRARPTHPVFIDPSSAAGSLILDLEAAGVPLELVQGPAMAQACGAFYDSFIQGRIRYAEHQALTDGVGNAILRANPRGGSRWYPIGEGPSVSPVYAATLAVHGISKFGTQSGPNIW
jgi:phage terminase large subunit-like protein